MDRLTDKSFIELMRINRTNLHNNKKESDPNDKMFKEEMFIDEGNLHINNHYSILISDGDNRVFP